MKEPLGLSSCVCIFIDVCDGGATRVGSEEWDLSVWQQTGAGRVPRCWLFTGLLSSSSELEPGRFGTSMTPAMRSSACIKSMQEVNFEKKQLFL